MNKEDLLKKVVAELDATEKIYDRLKIISTPDNLKRFLDHLKLITPKALVFLQGAKEKGIFVTHWRVRGMEDLWREWARDQGIKEGHFLFEN